MKKILTLIALALSVFLIGADMTSAQAVTIYGGEEIQKVSLGVGGSGEALRDVNNLGFTILTMIKRILMGVMVIFFVYIGAMMIMSMGSNDEQLGKAKNQLWYMLVALVFINIPGTIYEAFYKDGSTEVGDRVSSGAFGNESTGSSGNIFVDFFVFGNTLSDQIVLFLQVAIFIAAVFMISLAGIQLVVSRGREEKLKEAKTKIIYTVLALIFVGIIEAWKRLAFGGSIEEGITLFESLANLALFFAVPVAIFFLTIAGYYFITSNGDEERVKKAKSIIINTLLATLILLAAYTFLLELGTI